MSHRLEALLEPLRHSPLKSEVAGILSRELQDEMEKRAKFYREMTPSEKVEFIDGEVVMHSPAKNVHLDVTKYIFLLLDLYVRQKQLGEIKVEKCLCVFPRNDYEPDLVYFGPEKAAKLSADTMKFPIPDMIVEVLSESTEARDRGVKFEDFAAHGVGEYWIVDPETCVIEQYLLCGENYQLECKTSNGEITCRTIPGLIIPVKACFEAAENLRAVQAMVSPSS